MSRLLLLTAEDCHLCDHGRQVLDKLAGEGLVSWRDVDADSDEGLTLAALAPPLRPVLFAPHRHVIAYGRLSEKRLRKQLTLEGVSK
jgi:hypothetical protein